MASFTVVANRILSGCQSKWGRAAFQPYILFLVTKKLKGLHEVVLFACMFSLSEPELLIIIQEVGKVLNRDKRITGASQWDGDKPYNRSLDRIKHR